MPPLQKNCSPLNAPAKQHHGSAGILRTLTGLCLLLTICLAWPASVPAAVEPLLIRVEGVDDEPLKNVQAALTPPPGLVRDGRVDKRWLQHFSAGAGELVREALQAYGYYEAKIATSLEGSAESGYTLEVRIDAGRPVRLSAVTVELTGPGTAEAGLAEKTASFPFRSGDILLQAPYEKAKGELLTAARELGYLDAEFSVHELLVEPATATARIRLVLASGPRYLVGETTILGATYYREELLRRYISFAPGDPFSYKALGRTLLNFTGSPYFRSVSVNPAKEEARDHRVPVTVTLVPSPRRTIRPGLGYGTDTGARGTVAYKDLSLLYPGHVFSVDTTVAQKLQGIGFVYSIPDPRDLQTVTSLQLNAQREDVNDTRSKLYALELSRTASLGTDRLGTVFFRVQHEEDHNSLESFTSFLLLPGLRLSQYDYDDLINPRKGYHLSLETRGTSRSIGSDADFVQVIAEGVGIIPLPWRLSLSSRVKGGATALAEASLNLPNSLRFFAGGSNSVRGYGYKSLGPKDASGEVVGGKNLLQGSIELERALFDHWALSLFCDAGNAFDDYTQVKIYQGAGIGLHYKTPIGAINLDLARQLNVPQPGYRLHFTIGFQL